MILDISSEYFLCYKNILHRNISFKPLPNSEHTNPTSYIFFQQKIFMYILFLYKILVLAQIGILVSHYFWRANEHFCELNIFFYKFVIRKHSLYPFSMFCVTAFQFYLTIQIKIKNIFSFHSVDAFSCCIYTWWQL